MTLCRHIRTVLGNVRKISKIPMIITVITTAYTLPWTTACDLRLETQFRFCSSLKNTEESPFINFSWLSRLSFSHYYSLQHRCKTRQLLTKLVQRWLGHERNLRFCNSWWRSPPWYSNWYRRYWVWKVGVTAMYQILKGKACVISYPCVLNCTMVEKGE